MHIFTKISLLYEGQHPQMSNIWFKKNLRWIISSLKWHTLKKSTKIKITFRYYLIHKSSIRTEMFIRTFISSVFAIKFNKIFIKILTLLKRKYELFSNNFQYSLFDYYCIQSRFLFSFSQCINCYFNKVQIIV